MTGKEEPKIKENEFPFCRNIDSAITMAEMEYSMEKDQIEMLDLAERIQAAEAGRAGQAEQSCRYGVVSRKTKKTDEVAHCCIVDGPTDIIELCFTDCKALCYSLYRTVEAARGQATLLCVPELDPELLQPRRGEGGAGAGLEVRPGAPAPLAQGDIVLELAGQVRSSVCILNRTLYTLQDMLRLAAGQWRTARESLSPPCQAVLLRQGGAGDPTPVSGLREDIALIQVLTSLADVRCRNLLSSCQR